MPLPPIAFRLATAEDADLLAAMHLASWRHAYVGLLPDALLSQPASGERQAAWRARMRDGADGPVEATVVTVNGEPAGFSCLLPLYAPEFGIYLDNLHVLPAFQGLALGKQLLARCARRAAEGWPGRPLFLYVLEGNAQAREFYRRLGGVESARFDDAFPTPDNVVQVRRVTWPDAGALLARLAPASGR